MLQMQEREILRSKMSTSLTVPWWNSVRYLTFSHAVVNLDGKKSEFMKRLDSSRYIFSLSELSLMKTHRSIAQVHPFDRISVLNGFHAGTIKGKSYKRLRRWDFHSLSVPFFPREKICKAANIIKQNRGPFYTRELMHGVYDGYFAGMTCCSQRHQLRSHSAKITQ